jgi:PAS domain S-box-containing protein
MTDLPASDHSARTLETMQHELTRCQFELDAVRQSEAAWRGLFQNAPVALTLASAADGRVREVNARYAQLMDLAPEELTGRLLSELHLLPEDSGQERIALELAEHASVDQIANRYRRRDGTLQPSLSSLRLVALGAETLILSSTVDAPEGSAEVRELSDAQGRRVGELETEIAVYRAQERRLIGEISGLCSEASLLKSDIIKLKQMQLELSSEMENLRKHALLAAITQAEKQLASEGISSAVIAPRAPAAAGEAVDTPPVVTPVVDGELGGPRDALWEVTSARLQHVEEQLIKHVAALREQAVHMQAGSSSSQ